MEFDDDMLCPLELLRGEVTWVIWDFCLSYFLVKSFYGSFGIVTPSSKLNFNILNLLLYPPNVCLLLTKLLVVVIPPVVP